MNERLTALEIVGTEKLPISREARIGVGQPMRYRLEDGSSFIEDATWEHPARKVGDVVMRSRPRTPLK